MTDKHLLIPTGREDSLDVLYKTFHIEHMYFELFQFFKNKNQI